MLWLVVVAVELLIFMCVNKLLAGTGDPSGMIYPAGYGSGENSPPTVSTGILTVPNFYGGDGSEVTIPDEDLPIAILSKTRRAIAAGRGHPHCHGPVQAHRTLARHQPWSIYSTKKKPWPIYEVHGTASGLNCTFRYIRYRVTSARTSGFNSKYRIGSGGI